MGRHNSESLRKKEREARKIERQLARDRARQQRDRQPASAPSAQGG
jgi:hypothetical protein